MLINTILPELHLVGLLYIIKEVLLRVNEQRNILHEIRKRKANWIGHILRRNCLIQRVIEGKIQGWIEVTGRRERRRKMLLDDLKAAFLNLWSADHKWSSGSALVVLLD